MSQEAKAKQEAATLFVHVENEDTQSVVASLAKINDKNILDYIFNKWFDSESTFTLLARASYRNNIDIVQAFLDKGANVNVEMADGRTPLFIACADNNASIAELLLKNGANPNAIYKKQHKTTLRQAARNGNVTIMKLLLSKSNKIQFDWNTLINECDNRYGMSAFHQNCQKGHVDCLQYLFTMESNFYKTKIDILQKSKLNGMNGLMWSCYMDKLDTAIYLMNNVYQSFKADSKSNFINETDSQGRTVLSLAALNGNVEMMEILCKEFVNCNVNLCDNTKKTALHIASQNNRYKCVKWLTEHKDCDANIEDENKMTPLNIAVANGNKKSVKLLVSCEKVKILEMRDVWNRNALDNAVYYGEIEIFEIILSHLLKRLKINSWKELIDNKIMSNDKMEEWIAIAEKEENDGILIYLKDMKEKAFDTQNFNAILLKTMMADANDSSSNKLESFETKVQKKRRDNFVANYIFEKCSKSTLKELNNVINNGLNEKECGFNDSLLFLSSLIDKKTLVSTLEKCCHDCLGVASKNERNFNFFKNSLLDSNIWSMGLNIENDEKSNQETSLFLRVKNDVLKKELLKQEAFIKTEILKQEKESNLAWNQLKSVQDFSVSLDMQQNSLIGTFAKDNGIDFMKEKGINCDYMKKQLPLNNTNGFNGSQEYDENSFLSNLLIRSYIIDPIFQSDCRKLFSHKKLGYKCYFCEGPIKTKGRCKMKARMDYGERRWPYTSNLLDLVRCSVVFNTSADLVSGLVKCRHLIEKLKEGGCIKKIIRVKNGFSELNNDGYYDYADIKLNVLIEYKNIAMIAEIQLILSFMLDAKKQGHSIYSFLRNEPLFDNLFNNDTLTSDEIPMRKCILTKNMSQFSQLLENCNRQEKEHILKNQAKIIQFVKDNEWKKGVKLFQLVVAKWQAK